MKKSAEGLGGGRGFGLVNLVAFLYSNIKHSRRDVNTGTCFIFPRPEGSSAVEQGKPLSAAQRSHGSGDL
jgi:hypothetical protein